MPETRGQFPFRYALGRHFAKCDSCVRDADQKLRSLAKPRKREKVENSAAVESVAGTDQGRVTDRRNDAGDDRRNGASLK